MLFLKSTSVSKAPGIYEVDVAAKPPGKTFGVYLATNPDQSPAALLAQLRALGFEEVHRKGYTHRDRGQVLDLHFEKKGTGRRQTGTQTGPWPQRRATPEPERSAIPLGLQRRCNGHRETGRRHSPVRP